MAYESGQRDRRAAYPDQPPSTIHCNNSILHVVDVYIYRCMPAVDAWIPSLSPFLPSNFEKNFFFFGYKAILTMGSRFERRRREMCKRETNACQRGMTKAYIQRHRKKVHYFERNLYTRKRGKRRRNLLHFHAYRIVFKNPPKNGGGENNMKKRNST